MSATSVRERATADRCRPDHGRHGHVVAVARASLSRSGPRHRTVRRCGARSGHPHAPGPRGSDSRPGLPAGSRRSARPVRPARPDVRRPGAALPRPRRSARARGHGLRSADGSRRLRPLLPGVPPGVAALGLFGGEYLQSVVGGEHTAPAVAASFIVVTWLLNSAGLRASATGQVVLTGVLLVVVGVAVVAAVPHVNTGNYTPVAPDGWAALVPASFLLVWVLTGWEASANLAHSLAPDSLSRVVAGAVLTVAAAFLGLSWAMVGVQDLGNAPVADLLSRTLGPAAVAVGVGLALALTRPRCPSSFSRSPRAPGSCHAAGGAATPRRQPRSPASCSSRRARTWWRRSSSSSACWCGSASRRHDARSPTHPMPGAPRAHETDASRDRLSRGAPIWTTPCSSTTGRVLPARALSPGGDSDRPRRTHRRARPQCLGRWPARRP